jgi:hypothetical protein
MSGLEYLPLMANGRIVETYKSIMDDPVTFQRCMGSVNKYLSKPENEGLNHMIEQMADSSKDPQGVRGAAHAVLWILDDALGTREIEKGYDFDRMAPDTEI